MSQNGVGAGRIEMNRSGVYATAGSAGADKMTVVDCNDQPIGHLTEAIEIPGWDRPFFVSPAGKDLIEAYLTAGETAEVKRDPKGLLANWTGPDELTEAELGARVCAEKLAKSSSCE